MSIEAALYLALDDVLRPALAAMSPPCGYYDHAPPDADYPLVELARLDFATNPEITLDQQVASVTFSVWSTARGKKQTTEILAKLRQVLHEQAPALDTGRAVICLHDRSNVQLDSDGLTYMGQAAFTITVSP